METETLQKVEAQECPLQVVEEEQKKPKETCMLGIDPAYKNCGFGLISLQTGKYIKSEQCELRPFDKKLNQSQVEGYVATKIQQKLKQYFDNYDIQYVVIELQLGQFSADKIQTALVCCLPDDVSYFIQHSKLKLKHKEVKELTADNPDSNKYNQNKHMGRQLAIKLFPELEKITFDECDALLHCKYAIDNIKSIGWIQKKQLN